MTRKMNQFQTHEVMIRKVQLTLNPRSKKPLDLFKISTTIKQLNRQVGHRLLKIIFLKRNNLLINHKLLPGRHRLYVINILQSHIQEVP